ncbi:MAG: hypothetical protein Q9195_006411 [Heterodermia aff. obscurata]
MPASKPTVAFAGLGAMGYGMAAHLLNSGFPVVGYDVSSPLMDRFAAHGGAVAQTPREAVKEAEFVICMVATSVQATQLFFDEVIGAAQDLRSDATIIMCATVAPTYMEALCKRLGEFRPDVHLIDSPVSGGAGRAADGTLSIFSSGEETHLDHASLVLECMSSKLYRLGGLGGGSKAKMIHQIFAGVNIAMASEAMGLAATAGFNTREAFDELRIRDSNSWMFSNRVPHMLDPTLGPYSAINIIAKDVAIITKTSREYGFPLPLLSTAAQLYMLGVSSGLGQEDDCALLRLYLPQQCGLVYDLVNASPGPKANGITIGDIESLMMGVHLAAVSEAMSFCERLSVDVDLMFDIVSNAAGSSSIFLEKFADMRNGAWSLRAVNGIDQLRRRFVSQMSPYKDDTNFLTNSVV